MSDKGSFSYTKAPFWDNKPAYSLWILQLLTILPTGFFGIDHLFLRSPLTAFMKFFINIVTLGFWYVYDIIQVTADKETIQRVGLSIPFYGPAGIASGMFLAPNETADPSTASPWRFMIYAFMTLLPFGLDYLLAGDFLGAALRFLLTASIIFIPLGFVWGCYNMYRTWINPEDLLTRGTYRCWPFNMFIDSYFPVGGVLGPGKPGGEDESACREKGLVETFMGPVTAVTGAVASSVLAPVKATLDGVAAIPAPIETAVREGLAPSITAGLKVGQLAPAAISAIPNIASNVSNRLNAMTPSTLNLVSRASAAAAIQSGGGIAVGQFLPKRGVTSDAVLLFTLTLLVFGGAILTILRSREDDGKANKDDTPPNSGSIRKPNTQKQSESS